MAFFSSSAAGVRVKWGFTDVETGGQVGMLFQTGSEYNDYNQLV